MNSFHIRMGFGFSMLLIVFSSLVLAQPIWAIQHSDSAEASIVTVLPSAGTTTTLTASPNPSTFGQLITFTATVTSTLGTPTGNVIFTDGTVAFGVGTLDVNGRATLSTSALITNTHVITAAYSGDSSHTGSTSSALMAVVNARPSVGLGVFHSCAVRAGGTLACWGDNYYGQTNVPSTTSPYVQVSAGLSYTCAAKMDGTLACWGSNDFGRTTVPSTTIPFVQVSAGYWHACAMKVDGTLACWGWNDYGQANVPATTIPFVQVSAGGFHTCALKANGALTCWGRNNYGQTNVPSTTSPFVQVSAGEDHTCALKANGALACWGRNDYGQTAVPSTASPFVQVSAGGFHTCALKADGMLACWGRNNYGQTKVPSTTAPFRQVSLGEGHSCAAKADGTLACWGYNSNGQAPLATITPGALPDTTVGMSYSQTLSIVNYAGLLSPYTFNIISGTLPPNLALDNATGVISGIPTAFGTFRFTVQARDSHDIASSQAYTISVNDTAMALTASPNPAVFGQVITLTATVSSVLGTPTGIVTFTEGAAVLGTSALDLDGRASLSVASLVSGTHVIAVAYSGDTNFHNNAVPAFVIAIYNSPSLATGVNQTCSVKGDGKLACWGWNDYGQTSVPSSTVPFAQVNTRAYHTCAVKTDGTLACWGLNDHGQTNVPPTESPFVQVSLGSEHTCALKANGTIACWGRDDLGQPTAAPPTLSPFVQISTGAYHNCAIKANGALSCWGWNDFGQTNVPTTTVPYVQVSANAYHTCAVKANGTIVCWGSGYFDYGQTIVPTTTSPFVQVSAGGYHTCALKADGTVACWGLNTDGQTSVPSTTSPFVQVSAGGYHTCALKADGTMTCWGRNDYGQAPVVKLTPPACLVALIDMPYSKTFSVIESLGLVSPYTFSLSGTVPPGLTFDSALGVLSGTPTTLGAFYFEVQARDANNVAGTQSYTMLIAKTTVYLPLVRR